VKIIQLNRNYYSIPETWDELTERQLLQVMKILFLRGNTPEQMALQLLKNLTGMPRWKFIRCKAEELEEYFYLLNFLVGENVAFTKNLVPVYDDGRLYEDERTEFYGPDDRLDNLRMKEFTNTEHYFIEWCNSGRKDEESLNELIAILYRPQIPGYNHQKNELGDHREPYVQNVCGYYAKHFVSSWPPSVKLAISTWYDGCRRHIIANNPDVFEGGGGDPARYGLVSVMLNVAESHVFGDFSHVEDQYVSIVMMQLNELVEKARKLEAASKK
jgi:hypothetical protein